MMTFLNLQFKTFYLIILSLYLIIDVLFDNYAFIL